VEDVDFLVDSVAGNSKKLQKNGFWKEKSVGAALNVFTLSTLEIFNSENVKNKECVHTWANSRCDTSGNKRKGRKFGCIIQMAG
jgi:hypothetical protein